MKARRCLVAQDARNGAESLLPLGNEKEEIVDEKDKIGSIGTGWNLSQEDAPGMKSWTWGMNPSATIICAYIPTIPKAFSPFTTGRKRIIS